MNFRPCTVEHGFRKFALDTYPGLRRNPSHPRLLNTLLFPSLVDRDTGDPVLSSGVLAHVEGKEHQLVSGHYNGTKYIEQYMSDTGHHFELTQHNRKQHKACTVPNLRLDPRLEEALEQELRAMPSDPVDFATGRKITRQSTADQRKEDLRMAEQYPSKYAETQAAIAYMNSVPSQHVRKAMDAHGEEALLAAYRMQDHGKSNQDLVTLRFMRDQPKQFFKASKRNRSRRLFPAHSGYGTLSKDIAAIVGKDWYEFDLKSAQLGICSTLWDVKEVTAFLKGNQSIWHELSTYLGLSEDAKPAIKRALYALTFGASDDRISGDLEMHELIDEDCGAGIGQALLNHPLMVPLREARNVQLAKIRAESGAYDCYGAWVPMPRDPDKWGNQSPNPRSVLATVPQAAEFSLLSPVFDLARGTDDFYITHFAHDGFCLDFTNQRRADSWIRRITDAVNAQAEKLGICTVLELTRSPAR